MPNPKPLNRTKIIVIALVILLACAGLLWIIQRYRRYEPTGEMFPQANVSLESSPQRKMAVKEPVMGKVQIELERVISSWCNAEAGSYGPEDTLKGLWMRRYPTTPKYSPTGINNLIKRIRDNEFFSNCEPPHIEFGSFATGGIIQKVGDLNTYLNPCDQT